MKNVSDIMPYFNYQSYLNSLSKNTFSLYFSAEREVEIDMGKAQQTPKWALLNSFMTLMYLLNFGTTQGNGHPGDICIDTMTVCIYASY